MPRKPTTHDTVSVSRNPHAERLDADQLRDLVRNYYGTKVIWVDKDLATNLLELNTANRAINGRKLNRLVAQMKSGQFENTGEPIIISAEGVLNDGQHRLRAVVEADLTVDMDVRFGIARRVFSKTNTGTSRTGSDVLAIRGVSGGTIAPAVRLLILYRRGLPDSIRDYVSNSEIDEAYQRFEGFQAVGKQVAARKFPRGVRTAPLLTTAYLASCTPAKDRLVGWLDTLATGVGTGRSDPAYLLREHLMRGVDAAVGTRESLVQRFGLMIVSWNAYSLGKGMSARELRWTPTGKMAAAFPEISGLRLP
jgi:hypothetical protein